jgi:hypothetical protein
MGHYARECPMPQPHLYANDGAKKEEEWYENIEGEEEIHEVNLEDLEAENLVMIRLCLGSKTTKDWKWYAIFKIMCIIENKKCSNNRFGKLGECNFRRGGSKISA